MKNLNTVLLRICLSVFGLFGFGLNQTLHAQILVGEIGYSPIGLITNEMGFVRNVTTLGTNVYHGTNKMYAITLDYGSNKENFTNSSYNLTSTGKTAEFTAYSSVMRLNYTRYWFLVGELDVPFQCFLTGGYSAGLESARYDLTNPDIFTDQEKDNIKEDYAGLNNQNYFHFQVCLGVGMQYNFTRNIGLRAEINYGNGFVTNYQLLSESIYPKFSLCYKPDYILR